MPAASRRRRCATTSRSGCCLSRCALRPVTGSTTSARWTGWRSSLAPSNLAAAWTRSPAWPRLGTAASAAPSKISSADSWRARSLPLRIRSQSWRRSRQSCNTLPPRSSVTDPTVRVTRRAAASAIPTTPNQSPPTIHAVSLSARPAAAGEPAIACTLSTGSMNGRLADWQALLAHVECREEIDGGVRSVFAPSVPVDELMRLVAAEQDCCQFFRFVITVDRRGVALEVRAPEDALVIVESMFGVPTQETRSQLTQ